MAANPEQSTKITKIKENVKSAVLFLTPKIGKEIDMMNPAQNGMIASTTAEHAVLFTVSTAAAVLIDLKREKKAQKKVEEQLLTERTFWGSFEREAAKAGEQRTREPYLSVVHPIPPHREGKFTYRNAEDTQKAKALMNQALTTITTHPNVKNIDSICYIVKNSSSDHASVAVEVRPSNKEKKLYRLSYLELNYPDGTSKPHSIDQRITFDEDGSSISAFEIQKFPDGKFIKSRALSVEELENLQQKILSHLPT